MEKPLLILQMLGIDQSKSTQKSYYETKSGGEKVIGQFRLKRDSSKGA